MTLEGTYYATMDQKGRFTFPARLRDRLGYSFHATYGDGCVAVYSDEEWEKINEKVQQLKGQEKRDPERYFFSESVLLEPDKQGRVQIPEHLREFASLQKELTVTGTGSRVEIWDTDRRNERYPKPSQKRISGMMDDLGL